MHCNLALVIALLLVIAGSAGCRPTAPPAPPADPLPQQAPLDARPTIPEEVITVTIVFDNYQHDPALQTAWGFSCLIEGLEKTILFDTGGDGALLLANMEKLQLDPQAVDLVVLSHIHGDHTGGLGAFLERNPDVTVFLLQSFPAPFKQAVTNAGAQWVEVSDDTQICEHAFSTGELGVAIREQALILETGEGLVVITGCAHPGVANMARKAKETRPADIHMVIGGFHMGGMPDSEVRQVISQLKDLGVRRAAPCHCSGDRARELFEEAFGADYVEVGVGKKLDFQPANP